MRIGLGYDSHRFNGSKGGVTLGGVTIPHRQGLRGHSDADVLLHAIADALLGAIGAPDLGELFPPSDPAYRGADSRRFVREAYRRVRQAGWGVANLDATVVADSPSLSPHKARMRQIIARLLEVHPSDVSVKAKTTEGLPPGKAGIAAQAVVLLAKRPGTRRPFDSSPGRSRGSRPGFRPPGRPRRIPGPALGAPRRSR